MTSDHEQRLYLQLELYLSVAGIGDRGLEQCLIDQCRAEYPTLVRQGADDKPVTHREDLLVFLHQSTGVPLELCDGFITSCPVKFTEVSRVDQLREPEMPFATLARVVKKLTGSELQDFGRKAFVDGDNAELQQLLDFLMERGKSWKEMSKVVNNTRRFTAQHFDDVSIDDLKAKESSEYVIDWLIQALYTKATTDQAMRFLVRNGTSGKHLSRILDAYPTNPMDPPAFAPKDRTYAPVSLIRDQDGKLRNLDFFGKVPFSELTDALIRSALHFDDYHALDHIRKIAPSLLLSDDHVGKIANDVLRYMTEYQAVNPKFSLNDRWIKKAFGGTLKGYWDFLASCDELKRLKAKRLDMSPKWGAIFRPDLLSKAPAEFIHRLATTKALNADAVNQFIAHMHKAGIDCYQGFQLMTLDRLQYEDQKNDPVDYKFMVKQCLRNLKQPGFLGILSTAPMAVLVDSPKPQHDPVLQALYDLTEAQKYVEAMSVHGRGKAFIQELGV